MNTILQIDDQTISSEQVLPLLARYQMLPQLAREIIIDQAIASVECSSEEKEKALTQFFEQNQLATVEQVEAWLKQRDMSKSQLEYQAVRNFKIEKFKEENWGNKVESYFLQQKENLDRVVYSLLRTTDAGVVRELYFRIQDEGESFAELARQYSQGSENQTGGLIGPVPLSAQPEKVIKMLKASQPGQLCSPTQIKEWHVIIRLEKLLPAQLDAQMRQRLLNDLFGGWLEQQLQQKASIHSAEEESWETSQRDEAETREHGDAETNTSKCIH